MVTGVLVNASEQVSQPRNPLGVCLAWIPVELVGSDCTEPVDWVQSRTSEALKSLMSASPFQGCFPGVSSLLCPRRWERSLQRLFPELVTTRLSL